MGFTEAFYRLDNGLDDWLVFDTVDLVRMADGSEMTTARPDVGYVWTSCRDYLPIRDKGFWAHNYETPKGLYWVEPMQEDSDDAWENQLKFQNKYGSVPVKEEATGDVFMYFTKNDIKRCACALMKG